MKTLRDLVNWAEKGGLSLDTPIYGGALVVGVEDAAGDGCLMVTGIGVTRESCAKLLRQGADQCEDPEISADSHLVDAN